MLHRVEQAPMPARAMHIMQRFTHIDRYLCREIGIRKGGTCCDGEHLFGDELAANERGDHGLSVASPLLDRVCASVEHASVHAHWSKDDTEGDS